MEPEEKIDFVWLDSAGLPWRVLTSANGVGLYFWLWSCELWVWHGLVNDGQLHAMRQKRLMPSDEAALYHSLSGRHGGPN